MRLELTLDVSDLSTASTFWQAALNYTYDGEIEDQYVTLSGDGPKLTLQKVPETKLHKNRLHLDVYVPDVDAEIERLVGLGGSLVTPTANEQFGHRWFVLADPDGNEFCVAHDGV
jgi:predicted enzyme related to lactoylglutathione lyase